jgi:hypothetical protein
MEFAGFWLMNAKCTGWLLVSITLAVMAWMLSLQETETVCRERALEDFAVPAEPLETPSAPSPIAGPVPVESKSPVQSLEERDDAMLFESEALYGTPFTRSAVMPFD